MWAQAIRIWGLDRRGEGERTGMEMVCWYKMCITRAKCLCCLSFIKDRRGADRAGQGW